MIELNLEAIPSELKASHRWVLWAEVDVTDGDKLRKNCKPPYQINGSPAKHNDPRTWGSFDEVVAALEANVELKHPSSVTKDHGTRGIGMVIGPPFIGIDIDDCRNPETGELTSFASGLIKELATYTEVSPSKKGVHLWIHGEPPYAQGHRKDNVEIYSTNRYLTITGECEEDSASEIRRLDKGEVAALYARVKAGRSDWESRSHGNLSDSDNLCGSHNFPESGNFTESVNLANPAKLTTKIAAMMTRTDFADLSQAVQSLLTSLAIESICDPARVEQEFKRSALYNETHWKEKWDRLRESELAKAIGNARENIVKRLGQRKPFDAGVREIEVIEDCSKEERRVKRYYWEPVLQIGTNCHIPGPQASAKSTMIRDIIARITTGRDWPDQPNPYGPKRFILMNVEDDLHDTILPEIDWMDGDTSKLIYIPGVKVTKNDSSSQAMIRLDDDIQLLCDYIRNTENLAGFCIDPLSNYFGKLKMNVEEDVRTILTPLVSLAREREIFSSTVGHTNRRDTEDPIQRVMGAAGFTGVGRSSWMVQRNKEISEPYHFVMSPLRTQGKSFKYHTEYDSKKKICRIVWDGQSSTSAGDHLKAVSKQETTKLELAARTLREYLKGGAQTASAAIAHLKSSGHEVEKLTPFRIRQRAGVESSDEGKKSMWFLPTARQEFLVPAARLENDAPKY